MMLVYSAHADGDRARPASALYALLRWAFFRPLRDATEEQIVHDAKQPSHFLETVRGVQSIKLFGRQDDRQARWMNLVVDAMNADIATRKLDLMFGVLHKLVFGLERVAVVWLGALLVLDHRFSVGMLFAFVAYKEQFAQRVSGADRQGGRAARCCGCRASASPTSCSPSPSRRSTCRRALDAASTPSLELRDVGFRYSDARAAGAAQADPAHRAGRIGRDRRPVGLRQDHACSSCMLGLLAPQTGQDPGRRRRPARSSGLRAWRDLIGTVMQDDQLFAGSIADNISFFDADADPTWIEHCARLAAVHDEIAAMPMGYNTLIGDMGAASRAGRRQRVLLARALYKRPQILFLDEATSALDVEREREVNEAIRQLAADAHHRRAPAGDDRLGEPGDRAAGREGGAGPAQRVRRGEPHALASFAETLSE